MSSRGFKTEYIGHWPSAIDKSRYAAKDAATYNNEIYDNYDNYERSRPITVGRYAWEDVPEHLQHGHARVVGPFHSNKGIIMSYVTEVLVEHIKGTDVGWDLDFFVINAGLCSSLEGSSLARRLHAYCRTNDIPYTFAWYYHTLEKTGTDRALFAFQPPGIYELAGL